MALLSWKGFKQASSDHQSMIFKMALHLPLQFSLRCVQTILTILTQAGVFIALNCVLLGAHIKILVSLIAWYHQMQIPLETTPVTGENILSHALWKSLWFSIYYPGTVITYSLL